MAPQSHSGSLRERRSRHAPHDQQHPQRRRRSRPRVLQRAAQRAQSLDGRRSGGYSATNAQGLCFQQVHAQQPPRLRRTPSKRPLFLLVADSIHVHPQQPVNASLFAAIDSRPLIPLWFPPGNFKFPYSSASGVTCHPTPDAVGSVLPDAARPPPKGRPAGCVHLLLAYQMPVS
jgi:hypothetical protein